MTNRYQDLARHRLAPGVRGRPAWVCQLWALVQATLFGCSPGFMNVWRVLLLRRFGAKIGRGTRVRASARVLYPWKLVMGDHSWLGSGVDINNWAEITIGNNVCISQHAFVSSGSHNIWTLGFDTVEAPVHIEDEVWIAASAVVCAGTTLRRACVISAGAVVQKSTKEATIYGGNPARELGPRPPAAG